MSQTALAHMVEMTQSAIAEIERGNVLRPKKLREIARVLGRSEEYLLGEIEQAPTRTSARLPGSAQYVPVRGEVAAGLWREVDDQSHIESEPETIPVAPTPGIPFEYQFCLIARGTSLNKLAQDGDVLVCTDIIKSGAEIKDGDLVIVERRKYQGAMREVTAKRVRRANGGFELWPESIDPAFQTPIRIDDGEDDDEEIDVIAKVLWIMRKP